MDSTSWLLNPTFTNFFLMGSLPIKYMVMLGYTFSHGTKLYSSLPKDASLPYKFVRMIFQCTGGGIFVPLFINAIPVPLAQDAYPIAIFLSFLLHEYVPIVREIMNHSAIFKSAVTILFETQRASVVVKLTAAAGAAIAPSDFDFSVFGPIFAGTIAGCGGAFLPLDKGLDPIKAGLGQPMLSAFIAATCFHLFMNTSLSQDIVQAKSQGQIAMALFFIAYNLYSNVLGMVIPKKLTKSLSTGDDDTTTMSELSEDETTKSPTSKTTKKKKAA